MSRALIATERLSELMEMNETLQSSRRQIQEAEAAKNPMLTGLLMAAAFRAIREHMTPSIMADLMPLVGLPQGILVVKPKDAKPDWQPTVEVVRDVVIEGLLMGYRPTKGEMCIFTGGKFYATAAGNLRLIQDWPGLTDLKVEIGVPKSCGEGGALVPIIASWRLNGEPDGFNCTERDGQDWRIPVRINAGMGVDAIHGKAKAKLWARILSRLSGSSVVAAEDAEDPGVVEGTFTTSPPVAEQPKSEAEPKQTSEEPESPLDFAAREFGACKQISDVARTYRSLVASYPDYTDQLEELAVHTKNRIKSTRGPRANDLFEREATAQSEGV